MKTRDLIVVILIVAVIYLFFKIRQSAPQQIAGTSTGKLGTGEEPAMEIDTVKAPYAQQFTVASEPVQFPDIRPVNGVLKISTDAGNAGVIYIGDSYVSAIAGQHRYSIPADKIDEIHASNLNTLWFFGTADDVFSIAGEIFTNG